MKIYYDSLYDETISKLKEIGKDTLDIEYIVDTELGRNFDIKNFLNVCKEIDYDNSLGIEYIKESLQIIFKDKSLLFRNTYDGSEWWQYVTPHVEDSSMIQDVSTTDILIRG